MTSPPTTCSSRTASGSSPAAVGNSSRVAPVLLASGALAAAAPAPPGDTADPACPGESGATSELGFQNDCGRCGVAVAARTGSGSASPGCGAELTVRTWGMRRGAASVGAAGGASALRAGGRSVAASPAAAAEGLSTPGGEAPAVNEPAAEAARTGSVSGRPGALAAPTARAAADACSWSPGGLRVPDPAGAGPVPAAPALAAAGSTACEDAAASGARALGGCWSAPAGTPAGVGSRASTDTTAPLPAGAVSATSACSSRS